MLLPIRYRGFVSQNSTTRLGWVGSRVKNPDPVPSLAYAVYKTVPKHNATVTFGNTSDDDRTLLPLLCFTGTLIWHHWAISRMSVARRGRTCVEKVHEIRDRAQFPTTHEIRGI